jgi:hypothetical protein
MDRLNFLRWPWVVIVMATVALLAGQQATVVQMRQETLTNREHIETLSAYVHDLSAGRTGNRWTSKDQSDFVEELRQLNPDLKMPPCRKKP